MSKTYITRFLVILLFVLVTSFSANAAYAATEVQISGNSGNSSAVINQNNSTTTTQNNNSNVVNNVGGTADTGGNNVGPNTGNNNVQTGNANVNINICNNLNTNVVGSGGSMNNPCVTPTNSPSNPAPTSKPGVGGSGGGGSSSGSGGSSSGGGSVQGLSATGGNELVNLLKLLPAFGSLAAGYAFLRKNA